MSRYVVVRLLQGIIILAITSIIIFGMARLTGNPLDVLLPPGAGLEEYKAAAEYLGLDRPLPEQYWKFIRNVAKGDFGDSLRYRAPVMELIGSRALATLKLACLAFLALILVALPVGVLTAIKRDGWQDIIGKAFAMLGQAIPGFWLGILLVQGFSVELGWLPAGGSAGLSSWILPAIALGTHGTAGLLRLTRSAMLDILGTDFVRMAKIKGASARSVIWKHALRNALIPVVTFAGLIYTQFLTGSVVTETIFAWPGVGRLAYEAVMSRDFPLMQGLVMIFVGLYVAFNLAIDILYVYLDPRVRYEKIK